MSYAKFSAQGNWTWFTRHVPKLIVLTKLNSKLHFQAFRGSLMANAVVSETGTASFEVVGLYLKSNDTGNFYIPLITLMQFLYAV
jgi:hypothetical protein